MTYLFEVSWEVCNLVGGIYTVLRSKAPEALKAFGENYFLIGPLLEENADFVETDEPVYRPIRAALEAKDLRCRLGRWKIDGEPRVILVDFKNRHDAEKVLYNYWQQFGVDSMAGSWDYIEPVLFSTTCGEVIEAINDTVVEEHEQTVAHFHEWMCGGGLLYLRRNAPEIGTVFTTHATILGRSMAGSGINVYSGDRKINPEKDAKQFGVQAKYSMEAVCAREADSFTTVSQVTAEEAEAILGQRPHFAVFNGVDAKGLPNFEQMRSEAEGTREKMLDVAGRFLQRNLPSNTRLWMTSGRYEFHNKGFDVFLESLARLDQELKKDESAPPVVAWFLLATGHNGLSDLAQRRVFGGRTSDLGGTGISTHYLHDEAGDPILNACQNLGLTNSKDNKISVIFTPAYLDGNDGLLNMQYYDILPACDLGVFPSYYEPWGYTPLESIAAGVPTITTDLAGFGRWVQEIGDPRHKGVAVIPRAGKTDEEVTGVLAGLLDDFVRIDGADLTSLRAKVRAIAERADWKEFYKGYLRAYEAAAHMADMRLNSLDTSAFSDNLFTSFRGGEGSGPNYRSFVVAPTLPPKIEGLRTIASNLWWSWHPDAEDLFEEIAPDIWAQHIHNPVRMLGKVPPEVLEEKATDKAFLKKYQRVMEQFKKYMNGPRRDYGIVKSLSEKSPVVYFSMEFCLHECLPIYSGGLGVLSGDHLKAASDLGIPLVAVGLFYRQGYFQQRIDRQGYQIEEYPFLDTSTLPGTALRKKDGKEEVRISVELAGRMVSARVWQINVGRVKLYLLDTDVDENQSKDRQISRKLYGGDRNTRIEQEIVLGIGGVKLIEDELQFQPSVYHLNEGHCGFMIFERIRRFLEKGLNFQEAREAVKATSVFTTHTPVPAGNESFEHHMMEHYFSDFAAQLGISFEQLMEMGLSQPGDGRAPFSMTVLGLKLTNKANAVSKLHGVVCREMWHDVWKGVAIEEVPIGSITNGIHLTSWMGKNLKRLFSQYLDVRWDENHDDPDAWLRVDEIPSERLWYEHMAQKRQLIEHVKRKIFADYARRGESPNLIRETLERLNPNALTIGFARRFATYKRATLLFRNRDALIKLLRDEEHPVQILFAGKAHPADAAGKELIRYIIEQSRAPEFRGKIVYLENYNMALGRMMTQGVDVWLNTPVRPHEASGTSGMKVVPNGGINCSILDGWWDEAYKPGKGFAIQTSLPSLNPEQQVEMDSVTLLTLLQQEIIPLYYDVDDKGVPDQWVEMMKEALKDYAPFFTTMRMVDEYHREKYILTAERGYDLFGDSFAGIRSLTEWKRKIGARFSTVQIDHVAICGIEGNFLASDATLEIEMYVSPGKLAPDEVQAELIIGPERDKHFVSEPSIIRFEKGESTKVRNQLKFQISHKVDRSGSYLYTVRVVPVHPLLSRTQETGLARWA